MHFDSDVAVRPGSYVEVDIVDATTTHLKGHLVEVIAPAVHRTRIPVAAG